MNEEVVQHPQVGPSRRTVAKGAAWTLPVVFAAAPAAQAAASGKCTYSVVWVANSTSGTQVLQATSPTTSTVLNVTFSSVITTGLALPLNMTVGTRGPYPSSTTSCKGSTLTYAVAPANSLVLAQTGFTSACTIGTAVVPSQDVTIKVTTQAAVAVTTSNATLVVSDVSSSTATDRAWYTYWDKLVFSSSAVTSGSSTPSGHPLNATSGTTFYNNSSNDPSATLWSHSFVFAGGVPSTLTYTQHNSVKGDQAIAISGLSFDAAC